MARNGQHNSKRIPSLRTSSNRSHPDSDWVAAACSISFWLHKYPLIIGSCSSCWASTPFTSFYNHSCVCVSNVFLPNHCFWTKRRPFYYYVLCLKAPICTLSMTCPDLKRISAVSGAYPHLLDSNNKNYDVPANSKAPYFQTNPHCWNWHCPGEISQGKCSPSSVLCLRPRMMLRKRCVGLERVWLSHGRSCFLYRSLWLLQSLKLTAFTAVSIKAVRLLDLESQNLQPSKG